MTFSLGADARRTVRSRTIGENVCAQCGEWDPIALDSTRTSGETLCATCESLLAGQSGFEEHHPLGLANCAWTVSIPASLHRRFTHLQRDWPAATQKNVGGAPLLRVASAARALHDAASIAADLLNGAIPRIDAGWAQMRRSLALVSSVALFTARALEAHHHSLGENA